MIAKMLFREGGGEGRALVRKNEKKNEGEEQEREKGGRCENMSYIVGPTL